MANEDVRSHHLHLRFLNNLAWVVIYRMGLILMEHQKTVKLLGLYREPEWDMMLMSAVSWNCVVSRMQQI